MEKEINVMFREHYRQDIRSIRQEAIECGVDPEQVEKEFVEEFYPEFSKQGGRNNQDIRNQENSVQCRSI